MGSEYHKPVMLQECMEGLNIEPEGTYVDVTFGGGGHSRAILGHLKGGRLLAFDQDDDRARLSVRGEREFTRAFRVGGGGGWQRASFEGVSDQFAQVGGDIVFDTRTDPILARNAVYGRAEWEHLQFGNGPLSTPTTPGASSS